MNTQTVNQINEAISSLSPEERNLISDGYHSFGELYNHRIKLYIQLLKEIHDMCTYKGVDSDIWKSEVHSDGSIWPGWFILGIYSESGSQITYHLPTSEWNNCYFAKVVDQAPEWDGHTSEDVLSRLKSI